MNYLVIKVRLYIEFGTKHMDRYNQQCYIVIHSQYYITYWVVLCRKQYKQLVGRNSNVIESTENNSKTNIITVYSYIYTYIQKTINNNNSKTNIIAIYSYMEDNQYYSLLVCIIGNRKTGQITTHIKRTIILCTLSIKSGT